MVFTGAFGEPVLTKRYGVPDSHTLAVASEYGAYDVLRQVVGKREPKSLIDEVKASNLRGRGGAGFPMGLKWGFVNPQPGQEVYLVVNADEGEPGTFKDRTLMENDPHRIVEGCILAAYALGAKRGYIYVRCELALAIERLEHAIAEAYQAGLLGQRVAGTDYAFDLHVHLGAGAYICGEETALLNSLEGYRGEPRLKPPFPAVSGLFGMPTVVNNLESMAHIPDILERGGAAWSALSRLEQDGGVRLYGVSGHVRRPGIYEGPVGLTLNEVIYELGGGLLHPERELKAVIPGGSSTPVLRPGDLVDAPDEKHPLHRWHGKSHLDVCMGVDTAKALGTMLGTCCAVVMDSSVSMVDAGRNLMRFYKHESCGQCTPCREGTGWLVDVLDRLCDGEASEKEVDLLVEIAGNMMGNTICALADGTAMPLLGMIRKFSDDFYAAAHKRPRTQLHDSWAQTFTR